MHLFRKLCDLFLLFFFFFLVMLFRNGRREERWEGRPRKMMHGQLFCPHKTKNQTQMLPSEIVHHTSLSMGKSPTHFMCTTIRFTENSVDCHHKGHTVLSRKTPLQQQFDGE